MANAGYNVDINEEPREVDLGQPSDPVEPYAYPSQPAPNAQAIPRPPPSRASYPELGKQDEPNEKHAGNFLGGGQIEVSVSDPEKRGEGINAYVSYRVNTKKIMGDGQSVQQYSVVRRYSDFAWLHKQLSDSFPGIIVPPLPDKAIIGRFSSQFIDSRRRGLEKFIARILSHSLLSTSQDLVVFLLADDDALEQAKSTVKDQAERKPRGFFDYFNEISQSISNSFVSTKDRPRTPDDVACDDINAYAHSLDSALQSVESNTDATVRRTKELANSWFEFGLSFTLLGQYESEEREQALGNAFGKLGHCADKLSVLYNQKADKEVIYFQEPIKDYLRIIEAVKKMMKTRAAALAKTQVSQANFESKQSKLANLQASRGAPDRIAAAQQELNEAQQRIEEDTTELQTITARVQSEIAQFRREKSTDFKNIITDYVRLQIEYAQKIQTSWESILHDLENM